MRLRPGSPPVSRLRWPRADVRPTPAPVNTSCKVRSSPSVPSGSEVVIKHQDIKGFMPGMTMPFTVKDDALLAGKQPGDLVTATLVVGETQAYLSTLTTTGHEEVTEPPPPPPLATC